MQATRRRVRSTRNFAVGIALVCLISDGISEEHDAQFLRFAARVAQWLGPVELQSESTDKGSLFRAKDSKNTFELVESAVEFKSMSKSRFGEREVPAGDHHEHELADDETYSRIKLLEHEGKIFLKLESKSWLTRTEPIFYLERSETYEAKVVEGSWNGYQNGEPLTLTLSEEDRGRYASALEDACTAPDAMARLIQDYRNGVRDMHEASRKKAIEQGMSPQKVEQLASAFEYLVEKARVALAIDAETTAPVYVFKGDEVRMSVESATTTLRAMFLPPGVPADAANEPNWKEKLYQSAPCSNQGPVRKTPGGLELAPRLTE